MGKYGNSILTHEVQMIGWDWVKFRSFVYPVVPGETRNKKVGVCPEIGGFCRILKPYPNYLWYNPVLIVYNTIQYDYN